mgnify:CR=1 FL=1
MSSKFKFLARLTAVALGFAAVFGGTSAAQASNTLTSTSKVAGGGGNITLVPVSTTYSLAVWAEWKSATNYALMSAKVSAAGKFSPAVKIADLTTAFQKAPHYEVAVSSKKSIQIAWVNSNKTVEYGANYYHSDLMFVSSADGAKWTKPVKAATSGKTSQAFCGQLNCGYSVTAFGYDKSNRLNLIYAMSASLTKISIMSTSTADLKTWAKPTLVMGSQAQGASAQIASTPSGLIAAGVSSSNVGPGVWVSVKAKSSTTTWPAATQIAAACQACSLVGLHLISSTSGDVTAAWLETTAAHSTVQLNTAVWSHTTKTWGAKTTAYTSTAAIDGFPLQSLAWEQHAAQAQNGNSFAFTWLEHDAASNSADYKAAVFSNGVFSSVLSVHHQDVFGAPGFFERYGLAVSTAGVVDMVLADIVNNTVFVSEVSATSPAIETPLLVDLPSFADSAIAFNANGKLLVMQESKNQITNALSRMISILNH